jgi:glutaredoxin-related protein
MRILKHIWYRIQFWIEQHLSYHHIKVVKTAYNGKAYDFAHLLKLEQAKLKEMKSYFETKFSRTTFDHENDIKWIGICIKLLDIMIDTTPYDIEDIPYVNIKNMKRFYRLHDGITWEQVEDFCKNWPNDLRYIKATDLYYAIRKEYTNNWWN